MKSGIIMAMLALVLAGCARLGGDRATTASPATPIDVDAAEALVFVDRLAQASDDQLAAMPARRPVEPGNPRGRLRHGLWLATPGHGGHDAARATAVLQSLLAPDQELSPALRALVRLQLRNLRTRQALYGANANLARQNAQLREQIQALTALERRMGDDDAQSGEETPPPAEAPEGGETR